MSATNAQPTNYAATALNAQLLDAIQKALNWQIEALALRDQLTFVEARAKDLESDLANARAALAAAEAALAPAFESPPPAPASAAVEYLASRRPGKGKRA